MKVLVLGFTKISYMPYMHFYIEQLKKNDCEIHLLYWKRDNNPDSECPEGVITHVFEQYQEDTVPLIHKTGSFYKYRKYALEILKEHKFDLIVVLHSTPGVLLFDILIKKFKNKFILDYRDFTYENFTVYKKVIHKLVNNAAMTFVSSDAYRKYLPSVDNLYTTHNLIFSSLKNREVRMSKNREVNTIKIRFWGFIRHEKINMTLINKLANDDRFELHYHGREQSIGQLLRKHCEEIHANNIFFHGEYKPEDRYKFIADTDLIHNMYENNVKTTNAMGNKYYDGVIFYVPQLCTEGSFMGEQMKKYKVGTALNPDSQNFTNEIYEYYKNLDWSKFENCCDATLNDIVNQYIDGTSIFEKIIKKKEG